MRDEIARRLGPLRGRSGGRTYLSSHQLAINLSFVLHERSDSATVQRTVTKANSSIPPVRASASLVHDGNPAIDVDAWLVPSVGFPDDVLAVVGGSALIYVVDSGIEPSRDAAFFRAPARLTLPQANATTIGIAALIRRPGGTTRQLIARGPFAWPDEEADALRTLERIIQSHAEQWRPQAQLWPAPAEVLLASDFDPAG